MDFSVLYFYHYCTIDEPHACVEEVRKFLKEHSLLGRIYISQEGINGTASGPKDGVDAVVAFFQEHRYFSSMPLKRHEIKEHVFPRLDVKFRQQLVALDRPAELENTAPHLSPQEWKECLQNPSSDQIVLDIRNDYEWKLGHFDGAYCPPCENFRDFPEHFEELLAPLDRKKTKVLMYCTGGIRCEVFSPLIRKMGFEQVFQLAGGVINYGNEVGASQWKGKLFVFDDRLSIDIAPENVPPVSTCRYCKKSAERYINCANMHCNELFVCCDDCLKEHSGCCSQGCREDGVIRPLSWGGKPFRRKHITFGTTTQQTAPQ